MSITDQLLRNNEHYAGAFTKGQLPLPPAKGVAIVACMRKLLQILNAMVRDQRSWTSATPRPSAIAA